MTQRVRPVFEILVVAGLYFGAAKLGLTLAWDHPNVSPVWPPTGLAIAVVLLLGRRGTIGVLVGAFAANALTDISLFSAVGISFGNALEAVVAARLLRGFGFHQSLDRARDVGAFVAVAFIATIVSATIGNVSLALGHWEGWGQFTSLWSTWWLGDVVGALVVAPLILAWKSSAHHWLPKKRYIEAALLLSVLGLAAMVTFGRTAPTPIRYYPLTRMIVPFFLWVSLRLGQRGTTLATVVLSAFAIWGTAHGVGPFVSGQATSTAALLQLQLFVGSNAVTFLFLAAVVQERRTAAGALQQKEQQLSVALDAAKMGTWHYDVETTAMRWSANLEALHGFSPGTFGGTFDDFLRDIHPEDRNGLIRTLSENIEQGSHHEIEYRIVRPDRAIAWVQSKGHVIRDDRGKPIRITGLCMDITERKQAEQDREELLAREQSARIEAEKAAETIKRLQLVTDTALKHLSVDELLQEMLQRVREVLEVDSVAILLLTEDGEYLKLQAGVGLEKDLARNEIQVPIGKGIAGAIAQRREPLVLEDLSQVEIYNPILEENIASLIGAPLIVKGKVIGVIHADTIKARRFADQDIELLQLVADRIALAIDHAHLYEAEQAARIAAEDASRMKDEFLATLSHELRTPLNAIVGWSGMLRSGRLDAPTSNRAMEVIDRNAKAQAQLIEDILDVSRIITGKLRVNSAPVELGSVIEAAIDAVSPAISSKNIKLEVHLDSDVGSVLGDADRLQQVIWNLLSNAVKFTPAKGSIEVRLRRVGAEAELLVRDNGEGIKQAFLPYVFDRFRQADAAITRQHGGLGLGLAIARHLIELHGGSIQALSDGEGKGATFIVRLLTLKSRPQEPSSESTAARV